MKPNSLKNVTNFLIIFALCTIGIFILQFFGISYIEYRNKISENNTTENIPKYMCNYDKDAFLGSIASWNCLSIDNISVKFDDFEKWIHGIGLIENIPKIVTNNISKIPKFIIAILPLIIFYLLNGIVKTGLFIGIIVESLSTISNLSILAIIFIFMMLMPFLISYCLVYSEYYSIYKLLSPLLSTFLGGHLKTISDKFKSTKLEIILSLPIILIIMIILFFIIPNINIVRNKRKNSKVGKNNN